MKAKGYHLNQVHSDQMVLKMVRLGAELQEWWPKATQGSPPDSSPLRSDGSCCGQAESLDRREAVDKDLETKPNLKEDY
jgi:hypothetical protein